MAFWSDVHEYTIWRMNPNLTEDQVREHAELHGLDPSLIQFHGGEFFYDVPDEDIAEWVKTPPPPLPEKTLR